MSSFEEALDGVIEEVVAPEASRVDAEGVFPRRSLDALAAAGILGLTVDEDHGGGGAGLAQAAQVVRRLASACSSTAMVTMMHYAATTAIEAYGSDEVRSAIGSGTHLSTLAFSEAGSRSQFWSPIGTATPVGNMVRLDARKSWVTAAGEADSYLWSSRPAAGEGAMTLWLVPADTPGLSEPGAFDGLGLRGNRSAPIEAKGALVDASSCRIGEDGGGLDVAMGVVLPTFLVLSAAFSVGLMEAVTAETGAHLQRTRYEHLGERLVDQPIQRADHARMRIATDQASAFLADTIAALGEGREDASLRVLEVKAAAAEAAIVVSDLAMKVCGGAAFRKELGVERRFRDARAARVMAPTSDALLDFVGRAINGMELL
jgi:isovaleryl-CoA dehydrogenase